VQNTVKSLNTVYLTIVLSGIILAGIMTRSARRSCVLFNIIPQGIILEGTIRQWADQIVEPFQVRKDRFRR
jgi:hypothetical protein